MSFTYFQVIEPSTKALAALDTNQGPYYRVAGQRDPRPYSKRLAAQMAAQLDALDGTDKGRFEAAKEILVSSWKERHQMMIEVTRSSITLFIKISLSSREQTGHELRHWKDEDEKDQKAVLEEFYEERHEE